jgi:phage terminase large subunit
VTPQWAKDRERKWGGPSSRLYEVRVLGEFHSQADDSLISLGSVEQAQLRDVTPSPSDEVVVSCDVARYGGDSTVIAAG